MARQVVKGSQIDITMFPIFKGYMDEFVNKIHNRFLEEKNDSILGYIKNGMFYTVEPIEGSNEQYILNHYSLNFVKSYKDTSWIVLKTDPGNVYNVLHGIIWCYTILYGLV
jgi:hypothetical protein